MLLRAQRNSFLLEYGDDDENLRDKVWINYGITIPLDGLVPSWFRIHAYLYFKDEDRPVQYLVWIHLWTNRGMVDVLEMLDRR